MKLKKIVIGVLLVIVGVPVLSIAGIVATVNLLNRTNGSLVSSGVKRDYLLYVPKSYDPKKPAPLVISMHAAAGWPAQQRNISRWDELADSEGFIVVYPKGGNVPWTWNVERGPGLTRDVTFISELIDTLEAKYSIDPTRIYANGLSNGGGMSFVLSCTLSNRIAAVGMVSAAQTLEWSWCTDPRPVPMIDFHGTADPIVPYKGGPLGDPFNPVKVEFPAVEGFVASWARRNRCAATPTDSAVAPDLTRIEYTGCAEDAAVVLYAVQGGGHAWPGGKPLPEWWVGKTLPDIHATHMLWDFFRAHPLKKR